MSEKSGEHEKFKKKTSIIVFLIYSDALTKKSPLCPSLIAIIPL